MARPYKQGLDYFPLDVSFFRDSKIRRLQASAGPLAVYLYVKILTLVYENGYYIELDIHRLAEDIQIDITRWTKVENVKRLINACVDCGLLDSQLASQGVITSVAIQKQFLASTTRRKRVDTSKYWLLEETHEYHEASFNTSKMAVISDELIVNVDNNEVNVDTNKQSQSQSQSKRDKLINLDKGVYGEPKLHFITNVLIKNKYIGNNDLLIGKFNLLVEDLINRYGFNEVLTVTDYIVMYSKKSHINIENPYDYYKASAERNLSQMVSRQNGGTFNIEKELKKLTKELGKEN